MHVRRVRVSRLIAKILPFSPALFLAAAIPALVLRLRIPPGLRLALPAVLSTLLPVSHRSRTVRRNVLPSAARMGFAAVLAAAASSMFALVLRQTQAAKNHQPCETSE
jgi:hypothetical protein